MGKKAVLVIKRNEQNNVILRRSSSAEFTSQQSEKTLPTRLSKWNKSTYICCSNCNRSVFQRNPGDKKSGRKMREVDVGRGVTEELGPELLLAFTGYE